MRTPKLPFLLVAAIALAVASQAKTITVTTVDSANPPSGQTSLKQALEQLADGDTINFNIPGAGPHYLPTPLNGYPYIRVSNVLIDGYSQPGSSANTNSILAANSAKIMIVLDSRNGNYTPMDYTGAGGSPGYGTSEVSILGLIDVSNVRTRGLAFLGILSPTDPVTSEPLSLYSVSFANSGGATVQSNQVAGCWFGVDPQNGTTVAPTYYGVTGWGDPPILEDTIIGVRPGATDAEAKASFNVFCGQSIPIIIEGDRTRISGNFIGVLPDGMHDFNITLDPATYADYSWEGHIELGDHSTAVIGTDGDGVNDALERNVLGGGLDGSVILPGGVNAAGYARTIETYGGTCDNIIIAGNYIGVAIDGLTRFTNSTTPADASRGTGRYRFGSDFDGVSDDLEGNVVCNNWPPSLVTPEYLASRLPDNLRGFWNLSTSGSITYRGNTLINNNPFPMSPTRSDAAEPDAWLTNYYVGAGGVGRVLADASQGLKPVLSTSSSASSLIGTAPIPLAPYTTTVLDLYLADPEGIQTGKDLGSTPAGDPYKSYFTNGFVQGKVYLKSFVVDGAGDLDPAPGAFNFSLAGVDLKGGQNLTAAATYSEDAAGTHNAYGVTSPFADPISLQLGLIVSAVTQNARTDRPAVQYTGQTFNVENPFGTVLRANYTVPKFGEDVLALTDRIHEWNGATTNVALPTYLVGQDYVLTANNNRDVTNFSLTLQLSRDATVYVLVDNRVGDGNAANPPAVGPSATLMKWLDPAQGWVSAATGRNRSGSRLVPDETGVDEVGTAGVGPGVEVQNFASVYAKYLSAAGSVTLGAMGEGNRNMYGAVVVPGRGPGLVAPVQLTATVSAGNVQLTWTGGVGPYYVDRTDSLSGQTVSWTQVAGPLDGNSATLPVGGSQGYYRARSAE